VRPRGRIVRGPQMFTGQFVLLTVVHATGSKGLSGLDIATRRTLSALATTEEGECGEDDVSEGHDTDSGDESDDETLVLSVAGQVEVAVHITAVVDGVGGISAVIVVVAATVGGGGQGRVRGGVGRVGRGPRCDILLELPGGLIGTADSTTCGAFRESEGDVIRDLIGNLLDLRLVDAKSSRKNISGQTEESLSDLVYAWERIPEEGDEGDRLTTVVVLKMDGTLREKGGLVREYLIENELSAVLGDHSGDERAVGDEIELWGPRMGMRGVHTARSKETGSDGDIISDGSRHGLRVG